MVDYWNIDGIHLLKTPFFITDMASRQTGLKKFNHQQCDTLYRKTYSVKFRWADILSPTLYDYLEGVKTSFNCPKALAMGALLPMTSATCGPQTIVNAMNFNMPLNIFNLANCAPGAGKSVAFTKFVSEPCEHLYREYGINPLLECYSNAGLHRHHADNKNYAIVSSDEGHRIFAGIASKEGRSEAERALINKLWNGKGDKTSLKDGERGFTMSSFSMAIFIQPQPVINELTTLGIESDGFYDRFTFMVDKPKIHVATEQRRAKKN